MYLKEELQKLTEREHYVYHQEAFILATLMIEHIFSYISAIFRKWEIALKGVQDLNGIFRAPKEYTLFIV